MRIGDKLMSDKTGFKDGHTKGHTKPTNSEKVKPSSAPPTPKPKK
ncbi:hypothetical protein GHNINEIG_00208 [Hydrogenovibrio crunogenus]|uniref:Uncharacterized protein n=1 Tax=Hydrogenovibrio crunogenus TaxID=39765 RepID=A0A4V1C8K1_9GAMM|nr:hypothetical protein GHNINEIG_00208 [Hydrogenovibrio crunogenus]